MNLVGRYYSMRGHFARRVGSSGTVQNKFLGFFCFHRSRLSIWFCRQRKGGVEPQGIWGSSRCYYFAVADIPPSLS